MNQYYLGLSVLHDYFSEVTKALEKTRDLFARWRGWGEGGAEHRYRDGKGGGGDMFVRWRGWGTGWSRTLV